MQTSSYAKNDHFAQWLEVEHLDSSFSGARCRLRILPQHRNGLGTPHGAVIFALADIVFACACNASEASYIGLQADIRYLNRASGDELIAHAELVGASGRLAHYQISVNDAPGNRVALISASAYRLPQP
ncbi:PaaI family thioesterase [Pseudomonas sp. Gutcm_11s]|uniref:PaaI family thioesterase n=1 Tax=Pseudomonas sp. Gutcm_11s TaxID=3026088 RepID=UPI00236079BB|nr:PaaI family thioesterase [Pseudomonas sp. Gutcm_11s]MDD0844183.1 PaaI family thioesterase [Pseudomonas sp. Gutcm_11s]